MGKDLAAQVQFLMDREAIRDVITRYSYGADRLAPDVLRSVYWPDATDDHGVFAGSADEYISYLELSAAVMDQMQHLVGNMLIRNTGSTARCESYFHGYHRVRGEGGDPVDMIVSGRYLDAMERRDGEWRIIRRKVVFDWVRHYADSADWSQGIAGVSVKMGGKLPDDPSVAWFAQDDLAAPAITNGSRLA